MYFAGSTDDWDPTQLYLPSQDWTPPTDEIPIEFRARVSDFLRRLKKGFRLRRGTGNLLPYQQYLLRALRHSNMFIVVPTDKNLGPAVLEMTTYIQRSYSDHLSDATTYRQMTPDDFFAALRKVSDYLHDFLREHADAITKSDATYLRRHLTSISDRSHSAFYLLIKIHKNPWSTRPIVSQCGSLTYGIGRWVDKQLQPFARRLSSYIKSSRALLLKLAPHRLPPGARLFTMDAVSMYTNIDTAHALTSISNHLSNQPDCYNHAAILRALEIVMKYCYFSFGDTAWHQIQGTAMGAPPAPAYATLYYGVHEMDTLLPTFRDRLGFYFRYIDDGLGAWLPHPHPPTDAALWAAFQDSTPFGRLT
jgi:hypothetical protein